MEVAYIQQQQYSSYYMHTYSTLSRPVNLSMNTVVTIARPSPPPLQVKSGNLNCTVENLKESANKGHNIRLSTMIDEAYNKTILAKFALFILVTCSCR